MVRWGARLWLVLAFLLLISSHASAAESFSGCFETQPLDRFWLSPEYLESNPAILDLLVAQFYSFGFDNSTQGIGLSSLDLCDSICLGQRLGPAERQELSLATSALSALPGSLSSAGRGSASAHSLSLGAQSAIRSALDPLAYISLFAPYPGVGSEKLRLALALPDFSSYVLFYPDYFSQALSGSADSYEAANKALEALAAKSDSQYAFLSKAGAGSPQYSGTAKGAFLRAKSLLSSGSFCTSARAASIAEYFGSRPPIPDFTGVGFHEYLQSAAGNRESSSLLKLLSIYRELRDASAGMAQEYETGQLSAQSSVSALQSEISALQSERLDMISGVPQQAALQGEVAVGDSFSGIYGGLEAGQSRLEESRAMLDGARRLKGSPQQDNYLADALSSAQSADETAQTAISSLARVRSNAEAAVLAERHEAERAISSAEEKAKLQQSSFSDTQALSYASQKLSDAKAALWSADGKKTLGERFSAYKNAWGLALAASSAIVGRESYSLRDEAGKESEALLLLASRAQADGLDAAYEREKALQYKSMIAAATSSDVFLAVSQSAHEDAQALLLRLYEKYSYLELQHSRAKAMVGAIRETQPSFLSPSFDSLQNYFPSGRLDAAVSAGRLKEIAQSVSDANAKAEAALPAYLSALLTRNARADEIFDAPVLGRAGAYSAIISTSNPTDFSYSGVLSFSAPTLVALYSSDFSGGDPIADASYEKGRASILLNGVEAKQALSFTFLRPDQPAQITSSHDECISASDSQAGMKRAISFFASRAIPSLHISEQVPEGAQGAKAAYAGSLYPLPSAYSGSGPILSGEIPNVKQGTGTLEVSYFLLQPFSMSQGTRTYEYLPLGAKKVSYELEITGAKVDCGSATVSLDEPFSDVYGFSVVPLGAQKVLQQKAAPSAAGTHAYFTFSPLAAGATGRFLVSFTLQNDSQALSEAFLSAELQALRYNRTRDISALAEARLLSSQNRTDDALSILSKMQEEGKALPYAELDRQGYLKQKSAAQSLLDSAQTAAAQIASSNSSPGAGKLSALLQKLAIAISSADDLAQGGDYPKALSAIRKAESEFSSALSSLAWSSASEAEDSYSKAAKLWAGAPDEKLRQAQDGIAGANRLYSQGEALQSYVASSAAKSQISALLGEIADSGAAAEAEADAMRLSFSLLRGQAEPLLSAYSSQYASLSGQSKKQMPFTPSEAQKRLDDADKALAASSKSTLSAQEKLAAANASCQKLLSLQQSLQSSLSSLQQSASSSLLVAKAALAEVKSKSAPDDADTLQIESEVNRADGFLASSLYADSLMSSDRAISAANALLSKKAGGGIDTKTIILAAVSLLFIAGAAWFFLKGGKKPEALKKKKSLPKEE